MERNINLWRDSHEQFGGVDESGTMTMNNSSSSRGAGATSSSSSSTALATVKSSTNNSSADKCLDILARQIYQLSVYFDIYLEAESNYLGNTEIAVTKLFPDAVRYV